MGTSMPLPMLHAFDWKAPLCLKPPPCAATFPLSSVTLLINFSLTQTLAERTRRRFPLCEARRSLPWVASAPPCPAAPPGKRNRAGMACGARALPIFLAAGRRSPAPLPARWCPSFLAVTAHASRVRMRSFPSLFPSRFLPGIHLRRRGCSAAARLVAGVAPMTFWKRRRPGLVARVELNLWVLL